MTPSNALRKALFAEETEEVIVALITVTHPDLDVPKRFSTDTKDYFGESEDGQLRYGTSSRGQQFDFMPMDLTLPDDTKDAGQVINLVLNHVSMAVTPLLLASRKLANVLIEIVIASAPENVEWTFSNFKLVSATVDPGKAVLSLSVDALLNEPYPADNFTPSSFNGLWKTT